ncbi:AtpZ/AtpI family protein [Pleurocapsales cyanobacterium LEGE 06147]|nr:AtpZ/AtpI family protein [Pleurocapsales cyanobacterium LEGE 06147]
MKNSQNPKEPQPKRKRLRFLGQIKDKSARKRQGRQEEEYSIWYGLGLFGFVGWSIAIPTLIGIAIGIWIDTHYPSRYSWTLMLLLIGVIIGCLNAWYWIERERREP